MPTLSFLILIFLLICTSFLTTANFQFDGDDEDLDELDEKILEDFLLSDQNKPQTKHDNPFINYIIDAIEESNLYFEDKEFFTKEKEEEIDDDKLVEFFKGQEKTFIEIERNRLNEKKLKNKAIVTRNSRQYSEKEKKEISKRLDEFMKVKPKKGIYANEDRFIRAIESPIEIKKYIKENGPITEDLNDSDSAGGGRKYISDKMLKVRGEHVRDKFDSETMKIHERVVDYIMGKLAEKEKKLAEKFINDERKLRQKNIKKGLRTNETLTTDDYSQQEKFQLKKRWDSFRRSILEADNQLKTQMDMSDNKEAQEYLRHSKKPTEEELKLNKLNEAAVTDYLIEVIEEASDHLAAEKIKLRSIKLRKMYDSVEEYENYKRIENAFVKIERKRVKALRKMSKDFKPKTKNEYSQKEKDKLMDKLDLFYKESILQKYIKKDTDDDDSDESDESSEEFHDEL